MVASPLARLATRTLVTGVVAGAACVAYGAGYEVRAFRLRRVTVPVLAPGARPLRVLQVSDLHITPGQDGPRAIGAVMKIVQPQVAGRADGGRVAQLARDALGS